MRFMTQFIPGFMKARVNTYEGANDTANHLLKEILVPEVTVLSGIMRTSVAWAVVRRIKTGQSGTEAVDKYIAGYNEYHPKILTTELVLEIFQEVFSCTPQEFYRTHWKK
jgi:hypothetical protein